MYADKQSRGGILEPPGICEVKYRSQEQKIAMHRLDPTLIELDDLLVKCSDLYSNLGAFMISLFLPSLRLPANSDLSSCLLILAEHGRRRHLYSSHRS